MNILLTNDDGINEKGLSFLISVVKSVYLESKIFIYAPEVGITCAGRSLTFDKGKQVHVMEVQPRTFSVKGTPTDCVEIACRVNKIDLIISGINHGYNLGQDYFMSGTIQQALHAVDDFGIPAIAISSHLDSIESGVVENWLQRLMQKIKKAGHGKGLININLPQTSGSSKNYPQVRVTRLGDYLSVGELTPFRKKGISGIFYDLREPAKKILSSSEEGTDTGAIKRGFISVNLQNGAQWGL